MSPQLLTVQRGPGLCSQTHWSLILLLPRVGSKILVVAAERSHTLLCSLPLSLHTGVDTEGTFTKAQVPPHISERSRATIVATQAKGVSSVHAEKSQIRCTSTWSPYLPVK